MTIRVLRTDANTRVLVGRIFSLDEAERLRSIVGETPAGEEVEIDFSGTAEIHPVALASLVEVAAGSPATLRTRGLGVVHRRLLAYLGSRLGGPEAARQEELA